MKPLSECRLYTFVDTAYLHGRSPQSVTRSLSDGGSDIIQLRAKHAPLDEIRDMAGQEDFFDAGYRHTSELRTCHPQLQIGLSTHNPAQAERAIAAGADYIAVGPVYATGTKPAAKPVTLDYVEWAAANVKIPWFAIGGINLENLDAMLAAGARRIGVVSAILNAADITEACQKFKNRLLSAQF